MVMRSSSPERRRSSLARKYAVAGLDTRTVDDVLGTASERDGATGECECSTDGTGAPTKVVRLLASLRRRVDSSDDKLVDIVAPLLHH
jgi:hypothetical protein